MGLPDRYSVLVRSRRWLLVGAIASTVVHLAIFGGYALVGERVRQAVHRLTFEPPPPPAVFWKPPRTETRALEFRKRPIPRGAMLKHQSRVARTRVADARALAALRTEAMLQHLDAASLAPPSLRRSSRMGVGGDLDQSGAAGRELALPWGSRVDVRGTKESGNQVDMRLDLLSVHHMDTGQYKAMIIQDPDDRRNVSGYIHLAQVFTRARTLWYGSLETPQMEYQSLDYLIKALQEYTGIFADYLGPIALDDPRLGDVPWLLLPEWFGEGHAHTDAEVANLGRYLAGGGFAITQMGDRTQSAINEKLKGPRFDTLRRALLSQGLNEGADWRFEYLKPHHPIYHAFFDFDMSVRDNQAGRIEVGDYGLVIGQRLAVFISGALRLLTDSSLPAQRGGNVVVVDGTRHLQFTVNTVVFALTQEGGVTQQLMQGLR